MLRVAVPAGYPEEREYIVRVLLEDFLGLECHLAVEERDDVSLTLDGAHAGKSLLVADGLFAIPERDWLSAAALPQSPLPRWAPALPEAPAFDAPLPVLYGSPVSNESYLDAATDRIRIGVDVFGSAFFLLSRYEEVVLADRDEHDRLPAESSIAFKEGFLDRPVVNEYAALLGALLRRLWPGLDLRRWTYRLRPTHDVDWARIAWPARPLALVRSAAGDLVKRHAPSLAARRLYAAAWRGDFERDPANTFAFLMDTSEQHGLGSAFYFMAALEPGPLDADYAIGDPWIRLLLRRINSRGHELGIHPSYATYRDPERTRLEFEALRATAAAEGIEQGSWGGRQHYLRWEAPTTWQNWEDSGLDYDSTLGYSRSPGFRCGVCYPFRVFNLRARRALRLREHPLVAMEVTLLRNLGLVGETALQRMIELRSACERFGGEYVLLWHNSELVTTAQRRLYAKVLAALAP